MTQPTLVGMYFCLNDEEGEWFRTGRIEQELKDGVYLCRPDNMQTHKPQPLLHLMSIDDMLGETVDMGPRIQLFKSRKALAKETRGYREPSTARVLSIVPKAKEE